MQKLRSDYNYRYKRGNPHTPKVSHHSACLVAEQLALAEEPTHERLHHTPTEAWASHSTPDGGAGSATGGRSVVGGRALTAGEENRC